MIERREEMFRLAQKKHTAKRDGSTIDENNHVVVQEDMTLFVSDYLVGKVIYFEKKV